MTDPRTITVHTADLTADDVRLRVLAAVGDQLKIRSRPSAADRDTNTWAAAAPSPAVHDYAPPENDPTTTPYPAPGDRAVDVPPWVCGEAVVLARLADAGGDLDAHRAVHLEGR